MLFLPFLLANILLCFQMIRPNLTNTTYSKYQELGLQNYIAVHVYLNIHLTLKCITT